MSSYDFKHSTRALSGFGVERKALIEELWFAENLQTHLIIAGEAGNKDAAKEKAECDAYIKSISLRLNEITKEKEPSRNKI